jgi:hypothetical protein
VKLTTISSNYFLDGSTSAAYGFKWGWWGSKLSCSPLILFMNISICLSIKSSWFLGLSPGTSLLTPLSNRIGPPALKSYCNNPSGNLPLLIFKASVLKAAGKRFVYSIDKFSNISLLSPGSYVDAIIDATSISSGPLPGCCWTGY